MNKERGYEKSYPVTTMAIQNKVTECFKSMSVDEKRILIMASPIARNIDASEQDQILISAQQFADDCGIKVNSAYKQIENASKKLVDRSFSYVNDKGKKVYSNWVIDATYEDAGISLRFTSIVLVMLKILDKYNPYTRYKKDVVLKLKRDYSIDLKRRVLNNSLDEINEFTDITIDYSPIKKGRSVVGFKFSVKEKTNPKLVAPERDPKTVDMFCNMSDAQINKYSTVLSKLSELSDLSNFPDYPTFSLWIAGILRDPKSVREETAKRIFKALHQKTDFK